MRFALLCICTALYSRGLLAQASTTTNSTNTVRTNIDYSRFVRTNEDNRLPGYLGDYLDLFDKRSETVFQNRFRPLTYAIWSLQYKQDSKLVFEKFDKEGGRALYRTFNYASRELALDLPITRRVRNFLESLPEGSFLARTFTESVGGIEEQELEHLRLDDQPIEESLWAKLKRTSGQPHFGIRPLRDSPYVFMEMHKRDGAGRDIISGTVRYYYYQKFKLDEQKLEGSFTIPLIDSWRLDSGFVYKPYEDEDSRTAYILRLVHANPKDKKMGRFFISSSFKEKRTVFAGYSRNW